MRAIKIGSLCSGYGGLDLAVEHVLGARTVWHAQYDPDDRHQYAARVLARHWPGVPNHGDITAIDWSNVAPVDVLTAGFPCQDLSLAGRRAGMREGNRSGLWFHVARAIEVLRPSLVVIENVPGLLSQSATASDGDMEPCACCVGDADGVPALRALGAVLGDLARLGFDAEWTSMDAAEVGAPHKRRRVFLAAWPADTPRDRPHGFHDGARGAAARRGRERDAARDDRQRPLADASHLGSERNRSARRRRPGLADGGVPAADTGCDARPEDDADGSATARCGRAAADASRVRRGEGRPEPARVRWGLDAALRSSEAPAHADRLEPERRGGLAVLGEPAPAEPREGHERERARDAAIDRGADDPRTDWGPYAPAIARWEHVMGRPAPSPVEPSPAHAKWRCALADRLAGKDSRPAGMRGPIGRAPARWRLSPRFVEWMMGLPDGWVTAETVEQWRSRLAGRRAGLDQRPAGMRGSVARYLPIPRNAQLKALGNGVVWQQGAAALRQLLHVSTERTTIR